MTWTLKTKGVSAKRLRYGRISSAPPPPPPPLASSAFLFPSHPFSYPFSRYQLTYQPKITHSKTVCNLNAKHINFSVVITFQLINRYFQHQNIFRAKTPITESSVQKQKHYTRVSPHFSFSSFTTLFHLI